MTEQFLCNHIDDYLGPAATRFFGMGYRRADYHISNLVCTGSEAEKPSASATLTVQYPRDWSKKKDKDLRPHLSSIDTLVLCTDLCEAWLTHAYGLDQAQRRAMRLQRVQLRAGTVPQEELESLHMVAQLRDTRPASEASSEAFVSVFDCHIGAMRARCEIRHGMATRNLAQGFYGAMGDLLGNTEHRYFGSGFKQQQHKIVDVWFDREQLRCKARASVEQLPGTRLADAGIEGSNQPAFSMVDCFVLNLQMAQILMYELDGVSRKDSHTLWMLQTIMEASDEIRPHQDNAELQAQISAKHLLPVRGGTWRNVDITGSFGGIKLRTSLAHELPASVLEKTVAV